MPPGSIDYYTTINGVRWWVLDTSSTNKNEVMKDYRIIKNGGMFKNLKIAKVSPTLWAVLARGYTGKYYKEFRGAGRNTTPKRKFPKRD
jgi:hypothetical protein